MSKSVNDALDDQTIDIYDEDFLVISANCLEHNADPILTCTIFNYLKDTYILNWSDYGSEFMDSSGPTAQKISSTELDELEKTRDKIDVVLKFNGR